jgi:quinol monooxygenase YgiN
MSVMEVVRISCQKGKGDEFVERLKEGLKVQAADPACTEVYFERRVEDPDDFLMHIGWDSVEAHDAWRRSPRRDQWRAYITDLLAGQTDMIGHYEFVAAVKKPVRPRG